MQTRLDSIKPDRLYIRHMYETMMEYYAENIGSVSDIAGAIITENMINMMQYRYRELYGCEYIVEIIRKKPVE